MKTRRDFFLLIIALATSFSWVAPAQADVVGTGDITPSMTDEDSGDEVPDLPRFGGPITGALLTVGGTGNAVGGVDGATLTIDRPSVTDALETDDAIIGGTFDGAGLVRMVSLGTKWSLSNTLLVGQNGQGVLEVLSGSQLTTNTMGTGGMASAAAPDMVVAQEGDSQGHVTIDGFGSRMTNEFLSVGHRGVGRLDLTGMARLQTNDEAFIGTDEATTSGNTFRGNGSVYVSGQGTRWNIGPASGTSGSTGDLTVGSEGRGVLDVSDSGTVRVMNDVLVGDETGSYGEITVRDQGSLLSVLNDLSIGSALASGTVNLNDQGVLHVAEGTTVSGSGRVNMAGGTLLSSTLANSGVILGDGRIESAITNNTGGDIRNQGAANNVRERLLVTGAVTNNGIFESIGGEMEFEAMFTNNADGQVFARDAVMRFRGGLENNGRMFVEDAVIEQEVSNAGVLAVGENSSFILGDLALQPTSTLEMMLGDDHSKLVLETGDATIAGDLVLSLQDGYVPEVGDSFEIISAATRTGQFGTVMSPTISGISFVADYSLADKVIINAISGAILDADFDEDGNVDADDLAAWQAGYGTDTGAVHGDGDANEDGAVTGFDFLLWQRQYGSNATAAVGAVPEPSTAVLCLMSLAGIGIRRRR